MEDCNRLVEIKRHYFSYGLAYFETTELLGLHHCCSISLSTLKRWLHPENLVRRPLARREGLQRNATAEEIGGKGSNIGY